MVWYAHSFDGRPESGWETQRAHAARVASATAARAEKFGFGRVGEAAGQLHDLGKYTSAFQDHIAGRGPARTDRDHSSAGAVYARNRLGHAVGRIVAHIVAGHHAGLKDKLLGEEERLDRREASLGPVVRTARADGFALPEALPADLEAAMARKTGFALALLTRMLFSCLVDADRTETRAAEAEAKGEPIEPEFTATPADLAAELRRTTAEQDAARREDGTAAAPLNRLRTRVRDHVAARAELPPGIFTLTVPTGGGKTLTALRFALDHAAHWNSAESSRSFDRVIVVIPFTGVRIETSVDIAPPMLVSQSPPHEGADRNIYARAAFGCLVRRSLTGRGSKHHVGVERCQSRRRPLTGAIDPKRSPWNEPSEAVWSHKNSSC